MSSVGCIIYCTGTISIDKLRIRLAALLGLSKIDVSFVEGDFYELSIYNNDDFDTKRQTDFPDGFLYFKFIIEVGFNSICQINDATPLISKILKCLWKLKMPAVASCDYENLLPENGGYKSTVVPWPS